MSNKKKQITNTMQTVAVDILQDFEMLMMSHNGPYTSEEISEIVKRNAGRYTLCEDPFTRMLCTSEEYIENRLEYEKQIMMSRYGHCDGLEQGGIKVVRCEDCVHFDLCEAFERHNGLMKVEAELCGFYKSANVIREIWAEIDQIVDDFLNDSHYSAGDMIYDIEELKKKYTEEEQ